MHRSRLARSRLSLESDAILVAALADGSRDALAELFHRYSAQMHRAAARVRGHEDADDVVQEVFVQLWSRPAQFDPARGSLGAFLTMRARGRAIDAIRADTARRAREDRDALDRPHASVAAEESVLQHREAIDTWALLDVLTDAERTVISLAYHGSRTYREVAHVVGEPEGTIKTRIRTGLRRLRETLAASVDPRDEAAS